MDALAGSTALRGRGALPTVQASEIPHVTQPPLATHRQFTIPPELIEAESLVSIVWTPSETIPQAAWTDEPVTQQPGQLRFDIPPGSLEVVLNAFEKITGITVRLSQDGIRTLPSPGVSGMHTPERALEALTRRHWRRLPLHIG